MHQCGASVVLRGLVVNPQSKLFAPSGRQKPSVTMSRPGQNRPNHQADADGSRSGHAQHCLQLGEVELPAFTRDGLRGRTDRVVHAVQSGKKGSLPYRNCLSVVNSSPVKLQGFFSGIGAPNPIPACPIRTFSCYADAGKCRLGFRCALSGAPDASLTWCP